MHKQGEILREFCQYADYLESLLDECRRQYHYPNVDFRASRPQDPDVSLDQEDDADFMMGGDDIDQGSNDGNDASVMAICIPPQSLQVCCVEASALLSYPSVLNNAYSYKGRTLHPALSISSSR